MGWSIDRLGRSLQHLISFVSELHALDIDLMLHQQGLDTATQCGKAMFQMTAVVGEFERAMTEPLSAARFEDSVEDTAARPASEPVVDSCGGRRPRAHPAIADHFGSLTTRRSSMRGMSRVRGKKGSMRLSKSGRM
jgi:Resolvase, N terminal domain